MWKNCNTYKLQVKIKIYANFGNSLAMSYEDNHMSIPAVLKV